MKHVTLNVQLQFRVAQNFDLCVELKLKPYSAILFFPKPSYLTRHSEEVEELIFISVQRQKFSKISSTEEHSSLPVEDFKVVMVRKKKASKRKRKCGQS